MNPSSDPDALPSRALVVGAGVGGLAAAVSLHRAGWDVVVCERAPARRTGGYFVRLAPAGVDAASRLGVDEVLHTRLPADGMITEVDGRGRTVSRVVASLSDDRVSLALVRGDLERALWTALPDAVEVRFSTGPLVIEQAMPTYDPDDDTEDTAVGTSSRAPVRVLLGDPDVPGSHTYDEHVDLVVGADGVRSTVRGLVFGPEAEFRHDFDHVVVSAVLPRLPGDLVEGDYVVLVEPGRTAHLMAMSGHLPVVFFTYRADRPELAPSGASGDPVADLRAVYGDFRGLMPEILAGVEEAGTTHVDTVGQIHLERWSRGRVVLLGDAAWCPTLYSGYGSALALTGGEALGRHLAECPGDVVGALASWEHAQRPGADQARVAARRARHFFLPGNRAVAALRATAMRVVSVALVVRLVRIVVGVLGRRRRAPCRDGRPARGDGRIVHPTATPARRSAAGSPS